MLPSAVHVHGIGVEVGHALRIGAAEMEMVEIGARR
jgi:hypothetical protein